jgi:hypothetical protein
MKKSWKVDFAPEILLKNDTLKQVLSSQKINFEIEKTPLVEGRGLNFISSTHLADTPSKIGKDAYDIADEEYKNLRNKVLSKLVENNITIEDFLSEQKPK